jgi:hypothetical protein
MKGIYIALIIALAVLTLSFDASAQTTRNGVGNGSRTAQTNGLQNGTSNGTARRSGDIIIKGSKIGTNAQAAGSANGGVWKTTNGGNATQTTNVRVVETQRDPDRKSQSYLVRVATPVEQETVIEKRSDQKRSRP